MPTPLTRPRPNPKDETLYKKVAAILSPLPVEHPARLAFDDGAWPASQLLCLLTDEPRVYEELLNAIMDSANGVVSKYHH
jgi:hypothetical protein